MKLGILGKGMIVGELMKFVRRLDFEEIYLLGREASREKTEQMVREYGLTGSFYDYEKMLASKADVIYVALPNALHYEFARKALEAGKDVIVEKPAVSRAEEMETLMQLAKERGRMLFEAMNVHYLPAYRALKEDLRKLGAVKMVSFNFSQYSSRYQAFKQGQIHPVFDPEKSGGALMDINVYNIHAFLGLFGEPKQARYYANIERGIDTSGMMFCDYGTFKAVGIGAKDCKAPIMSTIQGDQAAIVIERPVNQMTEYRILYNDGREEVRKFDQAEHRMYYEFAEFIRMMKEQDRDQQQRMLKLSCAAARLMTGTRLEAGIRFPGDPSEYLSAGPA